ncbi:carbon starvation CstA family protein [Escherichia coli]
MLFGHHFAAIAGAGLVVVPVLAAQMGDLPGTLWLLAGCAGRCGSGLYGAGRSPSPNGASLGEMIKKEMVPVPGTIALFGCS